MPDSEPHLLHLKTYNVQRDPTLTHPTSRLPTPPNNPKVTQGDHLVLILFGCPETEHLLGDPSFGFDLPTEGPKTIGPGVDHLPQLSRHVRGCAHRGLALGVWSWAPTQPPTPKLSERANVGYLTTPPQIDLKSYPFIIWGGGGAFLGSVFMCRVAC